MRRGMRLGFAMFFVLPMASSVSAGPVALRHGDTVGKGYAFMAGGQCVVLTAAHVVDGAIEPIEVVADGYRGLLDLGRWTLARAPQDLAFATLPLAGFASCREALEEPVWMRPFRPGSTAQFQAEVRHATGRTEILRFRYDGAVSTQIEFTTQSSRRAVEEGDSGSLITMDGRPVAILTNIVAGSPQILTSSIDLAFALWRNSLTQVAAGPVRIPVRLEATRIQGQENSTMRAFAEERIQQEAGFAVSRNPADRACRVQLDIVQLSLANRPNPAANTTCSASGLFGKFGYEACISAKRSAPRVLYQFQGLVTATVTRPDGQTQIANYQPAGQFAPGVTDKPTQQFEGIRASMAAAAGLVLKNGLCGAPPPPDPKPKSRR
jgi:hypothetical protein